MISTPQLQPQWNFSMETINLFGASGHAKVIMDIIEESGNSIGCLYDDNPRVSTIHTKKVYCSSDTNVCGPLIISIGANKVRKSISQRFDCAYSKAIHPSATISNSAIIGEGSVVMHNTIVQADTTIGKHCIINSGASIDHECRISDFCHISPHATICGNVQIGEGTWIGAGSTIIQGIKIGKWCVIGAGSVVIQDIPDGTTVYGNPAKTKINQIR